MSFIVALPIRNQKKNSVLLLKLLVWYANCVTKKLLLGCTGLIACILCVHPLLPWVAKVFIGVAWHGHVAEHRTYHAEHRKGRPKIVATHICCLHPLLPWVAKGRPKRAEHRKGHVDRREQFLLVLYIGSVWVRTI